MISRKLNSWNYGICWHIWKDQDKKCSLAKNQPVCANWWRLILSGLLIFRGKKSKISRDSQGQIRWKIGWFRGIFAGKKVKICEKSSDFAGKKSKFAEKSANFGGFAQEKSQNSQKNRPISRYFSGKRQISKIFQGQILRKIGWFHGKNFGGKLHEETISKKTADFAGFFLANFAKIDQFCVDMTSVV